ncbi:putative sugar O-methyltransferase [Nocardiopsis ansamitocini]|uniref:Sugar O-methyltransferase n=1 Tax=Nocardiopsis ansamitocini TaxID=1670832 RepID=A0A9W6P7S5_9ACTN|nr:putative sugar O-methyltransferase [Nocardiopsis ansamitocini]GLU48701.1 hypothetical protein Nans01_30520 [Nocardiopsis ansamitocini]
MNDKYGRSLLWEFNNETRVTDSAVTDLARFKSSAVNFKLALWDPSVNGVRYLKSLIYDLAMRLSPENRERLDRVRNREVGDPITVRCNGQTVCMDYLQAVLELDFIAGRVRMDGLRVLEIGAGYGRTCHTIMSNHDIADYTIVDLDNSLALARAYLRSVLDDGQYEKIVFVPVDTVEEALSHTRFDLCLNIDSFAEMDASTVRNYLALVDAHCDHLYVNNPVGKYLDKSLDGHAQGEDVVKLALSTGLLRDVIDIYDSQAVAARSVAFTAAYRPGTGWRCLADDRAVPWSYYWQALYRNETLPGR